jgi:transposase
VIGRDERKVHFFAMDLPHSDSCLVQAYPSESSEAFCEGHNVSFSSQSFEVLNASLCFQVESDAA